MKSFSVLPCLIDKLLAMSFRYRYSVHHFRNRTDWNSRCSLCASVSDKMILTHKINVTTLTI